MKAVHQFVPALYPGDAVASHALAIRGLLRDHGFRSEIYVEQAHESYRQETRHFTRYARGYLTRRGAQQDEILLYQMAIGSVMADFLMRRPEPLVLNYHNITPPRFFEGWGPTHGLVWGRAQLEPLAKRASLAIAVSSYNQRELIEVGFRSTFVVPVIFDTESFDAEADKQTLARLNDAKRAGGADWLFVGRLSPNKAQHDIIKAFALYRQVYDHKARLHLVGGPSSERYGDALRAYALALGLKDVVDFAGVVSQEGLAAHYRAADVFVCCSEHEGFGVPLLEAMHHSVPVVAHRAAAVPETVADAGVLLPSKRPQVVSAAVHAVLSNEGAKERLIAAGKRRVSELDSSKTGGQFLEALKTVAPLRADQDLLRSL